MNGFGSGGNGVCNVSGMSENTTSKKYKIAVIPGDGIGKEVTPWAQKALEKAAEGVAEFEYEKFDLGAERYLRDGAILPEDEEEIGRAHV